MANNKPKTNRAGDIHAVSGYDVCQTPPHAIEPILPLLSPEWMIWESAAGPERLLVKAMRAAGLTVRGTDLSYGPEYDFFDFKPDESLFKWDVQVTNPPYSIKYKWIEHSFELGRPFALLVPYETTFAASFRDVAKYFHNNPWPIEKLTPTRRINFKMPNTGWGVTEWSEEKQKMVRRGDSAQMPTCWLTWGLNAAGDYNDFLVEYEIPMRNVRYNPDNTEKE